MSTIVIPCSLLIGYDSVPEPPTRVIAQNNALAAKTQHENPYLTQLLFKSVPTLSKTEKLFEHQASIIRKNRYTIDLQCMKYDGVARSTGKIMSQNPAPNISPFVNGLSALHAAAYAKCESSKASLKEVLPLLQKRPNDVGLILTIIQLYVLTNNSGPAITLLESFFKRLEESATPADQDVRFAPGLVALVVSLYRLQGRKSPIKTELGKAALYWRRKSKSSEDLLRAAGISLLDSSKPEDLSAAGEIFASLREQDQNDRIAIAGFVASNATSNISAVQPDFDKLTPVEKLIPDIDASRLEEEGIATLTVMMSEASKKRPVPVENEKPANKKIRKSKMPKDFEESKNMDPERWLPMKDRSSYRPKGKKGRKKALEATQGGMVKDEESLELVGGAGAVKVEKAPVGGGKTKKKKGKK
jgi:signal recognition particle subunit SRP72